MSIVHRMTSVLLAGYFGFGNLGDEIILEALLADLRSEQPDIVPVVLSDTPGATLADHGVNSIHWGDRDAFVRALDSAHCLVLAGGIFHDYWAPELDDILYPDRHGLAHYAGLSMLAALESVPVILHSVGVGPLRTEKGRSLTRLIFQSAADISVRDHEGIALLKELGVHTESVKVRPDPAFQLELEASPTALAPDDQTPRLLVNLRPWAYGPPEQQWAAAVAEALKNFLDGVNGQAILVPFHASSNPSQSDDLPVLERLAKELGPQRTHAIIRVSTAHEAYSLISQCDLLLVMRYHAALFGLRAAKPILCLAYDPKCESLLHGVAGTEALPPSRWQAHEIQMALNKLVEPSTTVRWTRDPHSDVDSPAAVLSHVTEIVQDCSGPLRHWVESGLLTRRLLDSKRFAELEKQNRMIAEQRTWIKGLQAELRASKETQEQSTRKLRDLEEKDNSVEQERARLANELRAIRSTAGFRLLAEYWRAVRRVLPPGSRRRRTASRLASKIFNVGRSLSHALDRFLTKDPLGQSLSLLESVRGNESAASPLNTLRSKFVMTDVGGDDSRGVLVLSPINPALEPAARPHQLSREFARRGMQVLCAYWRWDTSEPVPRTAGTSLAYVPIDELLHQPGVMLDRFQSKETWLVLEFPFPAAYELIAAAQARGWIIIYDVLDDWEAFHAAGQAPWYDAEFERMLACTTDLITAVSIPLQNQVSEIGAVEIHLIPNGTGMQPAKLSGQDSSGENSVTIGYFGHLTGAWFDWDLVTSVARRKPEWEFVLIGYGAGSVRQDLPANIVLKGPVDLQILAAHAREWSVGIVPFRVGPIAEAADVIKTYDYLALGLPVVTVGVNPPLGAQQWVTRTENEQQFIDGISIAANYNGREREARIAFSRTATWSKRTNALMKLVDASVARVDEKRMMNWSP